MKLEFRRKKESFERNDDWVVHQGAAPNKRAITPDSPAERVNLIMRSDVWLGKSDISLFENMTNTKLIITEVE